MASFDTGKEDPTHTELAWELVELFGELRVEQINEILAKNVRIDTLEFFASYASDFAKVHAIEGTASKQLPNMLLLGYLLRVLEERLIPEGETFDA